MPRPSLVPSAGYGIWRGPGLHVGGRARHALPLSRPYQTASQSTSRNCRPSCQAPIRERASDSGHMAGNPHGQRGGDGLQSRCQRRRSAARSPASQPTVGGKEDQGDQGDQESGKGVVDLLQRPAPSAWVAGSYGPSTAQLHQPASGARPNDAAPLRQSIEAHPAISDFRPRSRKGYTWRSVHV